MTQETLSRWERHQESFANATAEVLLTMNLMAKKYPLEFNHDCVVQIVHKLLEN